MPIYTYRCPKCGSEVDCIHKINERHVENCPKCPKTRMKKVVGKPRFSFKGGSPTKSRCPE